MSTSAAGHLPPAFPERAAWGTAAKLRAWQEEALEAYLGSGQRDFLAVATPGAGKTTYALRIATELLDRGVIRAVTVVDPPSTSSTSGPTPPAGSASSSTRRSPTPAACSRTSTTGWP